MFFVFISFLGAAKARRVQGASALLNSTVQKMCVQGWSTGYPERIVGEGKNAEIIEVKQDGNRGDFVVKIAKPDASTQEVDDEVKIMLAASGCPGVLQPEDSKPCLNGEKINTGAYVMGRFEKSLHDWLSENHDYGEGCAAGIASELAKGLKCLHDTAGYIHGDIKTDNILIGSIDRTTMCPKEVFIADFGLSKPIGEAARKYDSEYYATSTHLPDSVFLQHGDTLGIQSKKKTDVLFVAHPAIDWCSFTEMMQEDFNYSQAKSLGFAGDCGMMGSQREMHVVVTSTTEVDQRETTVEELPFCDYVLFEAVKVRSSIASHIGGFVPGFVRGIASTNLTVSYARETYEKTLSADSPDLIIVAFPPEPGDVVRVRSSIIDSDFADGYVTDVDEESNDVTVVYTDEWYTKTLDRCSEDVVPTV